MCANLATYALPLFLPLIMEKALKKVIYINGRDCQVPFVQDTGIFMLLIEIMWIIGNK